MLEAVAAYVRRKQWVVFSLVALWAAIYCTEGVGVAFHLYSGLALVLDVLIKVFFLAAITYSMRQQVFGDTRLSALQLF
jgi:hypothetical protein